MKMQAALLPILLTVNTFPALADDEMANRTHVVAAIYGQCYAKSVPSKSSGQEGSTKVYAVGEIEDKLLYTLPWYSFEIYMQCQVAPGYAAISIVRMGPWAKGRYASADDLALAFYYNGTLVRQYSNLEIAVKPENVMGSVSHYSVMQQHGWSERTQGPFLAFEIVTVDNKRLTFDPVTGKILATEQLGKP